MANANNPMRTSLSRMRTDPIPVVRSSRPLDFRGITSLPAGKMVPLVAFPLLREDKLDMTRFRFSFEMMETADLLANAVTVRVMAFLVPNLAFDRFNGIDQLNRSYQKTPETDGGTVIPYFETFAYNATTNQVLTHLGIHAKANQQVNTCYNEAYNEIWNFRAANRSPDIVKRAKLEPSLAKAFWNHQTWLNVVPDFDQAVIDGEVPLNVVDGSLPLSQNTAPIHKLFTGGNTSATGNVGAMPPDVGNIVNTNARELLYQALPTAGYPFVGLDGITAELAANGITVSLSNIELARKTQAFAALRKQYTGHSDDYIIDLLMNGITVPEQVWRQPILLADRSTIFGMAKRFSTTADDLTAAVANGATFLDFPITTPRCPTGGIVMVVAEIMPEQLFERQEDQMINITDQEVLPEFLRDTLDPEKVEIVQNKYVDVMHATPTGTFGYAPLNHRWQRRGPMIGGKFFRPDTDGPVDEVRQRFWAVETLNPTLAEDFYLCTNMHTKPFVVTNQPPFECVTRGLGRVSGNTVFGRLLIEASDDYQQIMSEAPLDRIDNPGVLKDAPGMETPEEEV